jgi:HlyD family secretion protein
MKRSMVVIIICVVAAAIAGVIVVRHVRAVRNGSTFQLAEVKRGDIENTVSSTGTLSAVNSVEVGAQVSGIIDSLYVDFNSTVKAGQVLAVLDTTITASQVFDARAGLMRSRAQLDQAKAEYDRNKPLYDSGYLSQTEFITIKTNYDAAIASNRSAEAALQRALRNLEYTTIRSPIDGTVIERNVDKGQTIQASFQAPTLFIIATDLKSMQIEVNVDESDIGLIKEGMNVTFGVQAYPDDRFTGKVRQVRLQPTTIQNVVNYTVIVDASNETGKLLPGMTATVDFIVNERRDVLLVPNSAIQFKPDQALVEKATRSLREEMAARHPGGGAPAESSSVAVQGGRQGMRRGGGAGRGGSFGGFPGAARGASGGGSTPDRVFYVGKDGEIAIAFFVPGATDGRNTEVKESRMIVEGMQVITGAEKAQKTSKGVTPFGMPGPPRDRAIRRGGL